MRTMIDFTPLWQSSIGFDRTVDPLDNAMPLERPTYPPCDTEKIGEDPYRLSPAAAGFAPAELTITAQPNLLVVAGQQAA
jgi:molecular chaperone IbpA